MQFNSDIPAHGIRVNQLFNNLCMRFSLGEIREKKYETNNAICHHIMQSMCCTCDRIQVQRSMTMTIF